MEALNQAPVIRSKQARWPLVVRLSIRNSTGAWPSAPGLKSKRSGTPPAFSPFGDMLNLLVRPEGVSRKFKGLRAKLGNTRPPATRSTAIDEKASAYAAV